MSIGISVVAALFLAPAAEPRSLEDATARTPATAPFFDERAVGSELVAAALVRAREENRRVLIVWGANWCSWCRALHRLIGDDEKIAKELLYEYELVPIHVGRFDRNGELAERYGVDFRKSGVPFLTILDAKGNVLASQETGSLEMPGAQAHDPAKVLDLLALHRAPYLAAEDVLAAGLAQAGQEGKRAFVHFGAPWCSWCRKLEAWIDTKEVDATLSKALLPLKIDVDRTVGGPELFARLRGDERAGIPWIAVLDARGNVLARGDMPDGAPIGFPREAEEIAAFGTMLAGGGLASEDVGLLERSLTELREREELARPAETPSRKSDHKDG